MNKKYYLSQNQLSLPFGQAQARALTLEHRERAFWFLTGVSLFSLGLYFYAINSTAHNIAVRQNLESEVAEMNIHLSSLEFAAIELRNSITIDTAREYGFTEVREPLYVTRSAESTLTLNTPVR